MRDIGNPRPSVPAPDSTPHRKRLGGYLVEAGLLTPAQVDVALNDQKLTGMRFGEILAARGWVKQQTIEYLMKKVVLPEQQSLKQAQARQTSSESELRRNPAVASPVRAETATPNAATSDAQRQAATRRETPISKPLPSVPATDGDISWVG